ncbi:MAG TPA: AAA family ATPase, partial [Thermoleophilia bacterium]|nr:AAA family ATPase [Thermoleophilia bacterium]
MKWSEIKRRAGVVARCAAATMIDEAPTLIAMKKKTHPLAMAVLALRIGQAYKRRRRSAGASHWKHGPWHVHRAILEACIGLRVGRELPDEGDGLRRMVFGKCYFAVSDTVVITPTGGSAEDLVESLWSAGGGSFAVVPDGDAYALVSVTSTSHPPSSRTLEIARDCERLRRSGSRVGLLLDGPPGSGKSEALVHVAARLGARVLRVTLGEAGGASAEFVKILRPDAVVIDDIDRMDTESALDAVDQILGQGCAVLVSSNSKAAVCGALLRSGRIDLHHEFGACEADIFEALTAGLADDQRLLLQGATVATVARHNEIASTLG